MKKEGKIKRMFPGGNTALGFYSYFHYIIDAKTANRIFFIKGGPGVGKSHMMKSIGHDMVKKGYDIEFHHCSADPDSIDAVVIPELKIALLDGTAPHVMDPKYPGAVDEIINLGDFWNEKGLKENREKIIELIDENGRIYKRVYKFLGAAKLIHDDIEWIYNQAMDFHKVNWKSDALITELFTHVDKLDKIARERHLFGSAYTFEGHIDHIETCIDTMEKVDYIKGFPGTGKSTLLNQIAQKFLLMGYDVEFYHEPLEPEKLETIIIPYLKWVVTTHKKYQNNERMNLNECLNQQKLNPYLKELEYSKQLFAKMMEDVYANLKRTKRNHDDIEKYYIPNIRFNELDELKNKLLDKILIYQ